MLLQIEVGREEGGGSMGPLCLTYKRINRHMHRGSTPPISNKSTIRSPTTCTLLYAHVVCLPSICVGSAIARGRGELR
jgi:hypothetical protein